MSFILGGLGAISGGAQGTIVVARAWTRGQLRAGQAPTFCTISLASELLLKVSFQSALEIQIMSLLPITWDKNTELQIEKGMTGSNFKTEH